MTARLAALWERPIAERERARALLAVAALLTATTILLALGDPPRRAPGGTATHAAALPHEANATSAVPDAGTIPPASAARTARRFLRGYLAYLYGRAPAGAVQGATPMLLRSLRAHPPRVSVDIRARQPRVLTLHVTPAASGVAAVSAQVNDGGVADYPVVLLLTLERGRLLVTGLEGEA